MTNKIGGIGKDWKPAHKEQKPWSKHWFWFVCKIEFEDYFGHVDSSGHKNSIHLQEKVYDDIDNLCEELCTEFSQMYINNKLIEIKDTTADNKEDSELFKMSLIRSNESFNKLNIKINEESSAEVKSDEDWEEINVIVDEISQDFTNRKENVQNTPMKIFEEEDEEEKVITMLISS